MSSPANPQSICDLLRELADLSEKHGYAWHSDYIRETIHAFEESSDLGWRHLISIQFWGGSGSISDCNFSSDETERNHHSDSPAAKYLLALTADGFAADNSRHMELLSRISKLIPGEYAKQESLLRWFERAKRMGEIYDNWLASPNAPKAAIL